MIPTDKIGHFLGGWAIAASVMLMGQPLWVAAAIVLGVGFVKEAWDAMHPEKHSPEIFDLLATCCGWIPVALIHYFA